MEVLILNELQTRTSLQKLRTSRTSDSPLSVLPLNYYKKLRTSRTSADLRIRRSAPLFNPFTILTFPLSFITMESAQFFLVLAIWLILCTLVAYHAGTKGHSALGFFLVAVILSPLISFVIVLCLRPRSTPTGPDAIDAATYLAYRQAKDRMRPPAPSLHAHLPPPPPGRAVTFQIAQAGNILGDYTLPQIRNALADGTLSPEDHYFDVPGNCWQEIASLPDL